jgi:hypothetical protein
MMAKYGALKRCLITPPKSKGSKPSARVDSKAQGLVPPASSSIQRLGSGL